MLPVILLTINIAFLLGLSIRSNFVQKLVSSILFLYLLFGSGLFVPLSEDVKLFFTYFPLNQSALKIQQIITIDNSVLPYQAIIILLISDMRYLICQDSFRVSKIIE